MDLGDLVAAQAQVRGGGEQLLDLTAGEVVVQQGGAQQAAVTVDLGDAGVGDVVGEALEPVRSLNIR